jgi:hypothetical protein
MSMPLLASGRDIVNVPEPGQGALDASGRGPSELVSGPEESAVALDQLRHETRDMTLLGPGPMPYPLRNSLLDFFRDSPAALDFFRDRLPDVADLPVGIETLGALRARIKESAPLVHSLTPKKKAAIAAMVMGLPFLVINGLLCAFSVIERTTLFPIIFVLWESLPIFYLSLSKNEHRQNLQILEDGRHQIATDGLKPELLKEYFYNHPETLDDFIELFVMPQLTVRLKVLETRHEAYALTEQRLMKDRKGLEGMTQLTEDQRRYLSDASNANEDALSATRRRLARVKQEADEIQQLLRIIHAIREQLSEIIETDDTDRSDGAEKLRQMKSADRILQNARAAEHGLGVTDPAQTKEVGVDDLRLLVWQIWWIVDCRRA